MPTILIGQHRIDPVASIARTARMDETLQLSARTVAWLADHVHARKLVRSVWDGLGELQRAGHHPGAIAALRAYPEPPSAHLNGSMPHLPTQDLAPTTLSLHRVAPGSRRVTRTAADPDCATR
jgi:hypothetical protein